jgi:hypothetical protein
MMMAYLMPYTYLDGQITSTPLAFSTSTVYGACVATEPRLTWPFLDHVPSLRSCQPLVMAQMSRLASLDQDCCCRCRLGQLAD